MFCDFGFRQQSDKQKRASGQGETTHQEGIEAQVCDSVVERTGSVGQEQLEWDCIFELFDEDAGCRVLLQGTRERDGWPVHKVVLERDCSFATDELTFGVGKS